jgi:fructokinase
MRRYALVEAGGTKFMCAVADEQLALIGVRRIETADPATTLAAVREFFDEHAMSGEPFTAGGVASFGPIDLEASSPTYGHLRKTPKPGWNGVDVRSAVTSVTSVVGLDTDVNAACLAEATWGAGMRYATVAYATIGTGIGVGVVHAGTPIRGAVHSEIGHIPVARVRIDEWYPGVCPYHGACLEGLACGPAIRDRWGADLDVFPPNHVAHQLEANYIAQLCVSLIYSFAPEIIVLGGGVMQTPGLFERTRACTVAGLGGYCTPALERGDLSEYIVPPALEYSGLRGALALALAAERSASLLPA